MEKNRQFYHSGGATCKHGLWVSFIAFMTFKTVYAYMLANGGVFLCAVGIIQTDHKSGW